MTQKEAVRLFWKSKRAALSNDDCQRWTESLTTQIIQEPVVAQAQRIMAYLAMPKEANLDAVIQWALDQKKEVYVPYCVNDTDMVAVRLQSLADVETGLLHIRVPRDTKAVIDPRELDVVLVPGVAFDRQGGRMGMGRGYYDRFLASVTGAVLGICWNSQLSLGALPMDSWDRYMDAIVTEQSIIPCSNQ